MLSGTAILMQFQQFHSAHENEQVVFYLYIMYACMMHAVNHVDKILIALGKIQLLLIVFYIWLTLNGNISQRDIFHKYCYS